MHARKRKISGKKSNWLCHLLRLVALLLFPIARADIWDHLRGVYGVGWGWIILAEVVNAENGLGYLFPIRTADTSTVCLPSSWSLS